MELFGTQKFKNGVLTIGGVSVKELKETYGTPLYIMDEAAIRDKARMFQASFRHKGLTSEVIYASKAFLTLAMVRLVAEEGLSLDVVSGGELYTALTGGFPPEKIYFHGNNKSRSELQMALDAGVGTIILDNPTELGLLEELMAGRAGKQGVMLRVNPGIEAHTHEYISTTKNDSKFGLSIFNESTDDLIRRIARMEALEFKGLHCHIGSQVFEESSYFKEADTMLAYAARFLDLQVPMPLMNLGGGFGVKYVEGDKPLELQAFLSRFIGHIHDKAEELGLMPLKVAIEPGRSLVANAGTTLYEVGSVKDTGAGRRYVFVDGSMADHIRTALYGAEYQAVLADRMDDPVSGIWTVTGKACESGDILVKDQALPEARPGDLLAVLSTGAYHYSMASNYNRLPRPAVVFVRDGRSRVAVQRETYEDLIRLDRQEEYK